MSADARFVALTPNPAIDRTLELAGPLEPGRLHRVRSVREAAGGKGVNVARVLSAFGAEVTAAGFLAGSNGAKFRRLLERDGLRGAFREVAGETRECTIVVGGGDHPTELNEAGPAVAPADWRALQERAPEGSWIVCGSLPPGLGVAAFGDLLRELPRPPVVDAGGAALRAALEAGVALVAPNRSELAALAPRSRGGVAEARALYERYGVPILLTLGAEGAAYVGDEVHRAAAPPVEAVNPVGSGDALLGAFLWARAAGWPIDEALRLGVAAGAENAAAGGGARISVERVMARLRARSGEG